VRGGVGGLNHGSGLVLKKKGVGTRSKRGRCGQWFESAKKGSGERKIISRKRKKKLISCGEKHSSWQAKRMR